MNTKFASTLVIAAAALGASSSFAFGTSNDNGAWSAGNGSPVALNPTGDTVTQPAFQSIASRGQVSSGVAQNRAVLTAVAINPQGPTVVEQSGFRAEQSRAAVAQSVARDRTVLSAVALNPNGDDALPPSTAQRLVTQQPLLATSGRSNRFGAE